MGILSSIEAEVQRLNPANLVNEIEAIGKDLEGAKTRLAQLEAIIAQAAPIIEAACPQMTPELTALLVIMKQLGGVQAAS